MIQLAFFSSVSPGRPAADLQLILATGRRNNPRLGITGMLIHCKGDYQQILEGPRDSVLRLFDVIQEDPRHTGVTEIFNEPTQHRNFPDEPMGFQDLGVPGLPVHGYAEFLREHFDLGALQPRAAVALFDLFKPAIPQEAAAGR